MLAFLASLVLATLSLEVFAQQNHGAVIFEQEQTANALSCASSESRTEHGYATVMLEHSTAPTAPTVISVVIVNTTNHHEVLRPT